MNNKQLKDLLEAYKADTMSTQDVMKKLETLPFHDLGYAKVDHHRQLRVGYPEVVYGEGKTIDQIVGIASAMQEAGSNILITRVEEPVFTAVKAHIPHAAYNALGRVIRVTNTPIEETETYIAIVAAGTSDMPVLEEACETALALGNRIKKIIDVGVAGIHRLFNQLDVIRGAKVVVVCAGMEGALASVVAGLVDKPVIAVPTSVGYGANLGGITTLLAMLNSCASGVSVVNIDNGFGAAYSASMINHL